jgi:hypothetical protein
MSRIIKPGFLSQQFGEIRVKQPSNIRERGRNRMDAGFLATTLGVLCCAGSAWAQISLVHVTSCGPVTFPGTTCTIPATSKGNLIVVGFASLPAYAPTISSISDSAGNAYGEAGSARAVDSSSNTMVDLWYAKNSNSGATTVTITPSSSGQGAAVIWEFSGVNTVSPLDQTVVLSNQTATTAASGGTVTTSGPNEIIISVMSPSGSVTGIAAGNLFVSDSLVFGVGWAHLLTSSSGTYAASWNASGTYAASSVSFKAATSTGTSSCDLNNDGVVNGTDVNLAINMALGTTSCTANLEGPNTCTVITVQRVVNASQGQTCIVYNSHGVTLTWVASTSQNVAGYNVYRGTTSGGPYTKLNTTGLITGLSYTDSVVLAGQTYYYVATTVDISSNESAYSAPTTATIPAP